MSITKENSVSDPNPVFTLPQKQAALRVLGEQRGSRVLKVANLRKTFGDRITKQFQSEVDQLDTEVTGLDIAIAVVEAAEVAA